MPSRPTRAAATMRRKGSRVYLRAPLPSDATEFLAAVKTSRKLHDGWVEPPSSLASYAAFVQRAGRVFTREPALVKHAALLVCRREDDAIVGVFNITEIIRGLSNSAFLGYYALAPHAGAGYMAEGLELTLIVAFRVLKLHRIEANVQPTNRRSLALVESAGFVREGYSRHYLRINGRWRDHVRLALLVDDWRARRKTRS